MKAVSQLKVAALVVPVAVLLVMVARAEATIALGRTYVLRIEGYDPRDLLRGQYLRFRVAWNGEAFGERETVCMVEDAEPRNPRVRFVSAQDVEACQAFINAEALQHLDKYFIPEDMGARLEKAIRERRAELQVKVSRDGDAIIEQLLLDGEPWRQVVERE